ncbi:hypothetical protein ES702_02970 [subsurface metagenome]
MTAIRITPTIYSIAIIAILLFLFLIYRLYFRKRSESFSESWLFLRICSYSLVIILILLVFAFGIIVLYITLGSDEGTESWIFTITNALLLGMYLNILGFRSKISKGSIRYLIFFILIWIFMSGFGYLGLKIEFREPISTFLFYNIYQSNSTHGIFFFTYNILFFSAIYLISFLIESENE